MISSPQLIQTMRHFMGIAIHYYMLASGHFIKTMGLSSPQYSILMQLYYRGVCGMSEVSGWFEVTPAAASQLVDKLVQSGLVLREEDPHDRRAKCLNLTAKGKDLIQQSFEEGYRWADRLVGKLNAEERAKVDEALKVLTRAAQAMEAKQVQHSV